MTTPRPVTVVLPMLNEAGSAEKVVLELMAAFSESDRELHVVCVNDGSTDQTGAVLARLSDAHENVDVATHAHRHGYGAAIRTGLTNATTPLVGWMDGDGQYDPSDFDLLLAEIDAGAVGAIGVRVDRADETYRTVLGKAGSLLASIICRQKLHDADAGIKVFDRTAVDLQRLRSRGSYISTEVLGRAFRSGHVQQVSVSHRPREEGQQTGASPMVLFGLVSDFVRSFQR